MKSMIDILLARNALLFWFGLANLLLALILAVASRYSEVQVMGVNALYKPIKFALSIGIYSLTMAWYITYLPPGKDITLFNWIVVLALGFEIVYITWQAWRGELSHFNRSTGFYQVLYMAMAGAATLVALATGYIGLKFFQASLPHLSPALVWGIRLGIVLFVVFSLEGYVMGSRLTHTIGGPDGNHGLPFLNWSRKYGDPRVAHFIGMHALQVLPLLAVYVLKSVRLTVIVSLLYAVLALWVLVQALNGRPTFK